MANVNNKLFTEIFRPHSLEQAIILPRIQKELARGLVDNILFEGKPGTGKTTLTKILVSGHDILEINASAERGIDVIRDKIQTFASASSLISSGLKVVVLEECDAMTLDAWGALRNIFEKYADNVRFIANCNYVEKIPDPILSRFNVIHIEAETKEEEEYIINGYIERTRQMLSYIPTFKERLDGTKADWQFAFTEEKLRAFVLNNYPDMRSIVKKIQQICTRGDRELTEDMVKSPNDVTSLYNIIMGQNDPWENYKAIIGEFSTKADVGVIEIAKNFIPWLMNTQPQMSAKIPLITIANAEHMSMLNNSIDKLVVLLSLVYKLQIIIHQ